MTATEHETLEIVRILFNGAIGAVLIGGAILAVVALVKLTIWAVKKRPFK